MGLLLTLGSAGLFGMNTVYARLASFSGIGGTSLVLYRAVLMLALVGAVAALWRLSLAVPREERAALLVAGCATSVLGSAYLSSVAFVPVTVAVVVFYTFPVLIVLARPLGARGAGGGAPAPRPPPTPSGGALKGWSPCRPRGDRDRAGERVRGASRRARPVTSSTAPPRRTCGPP